jgi:glutamate synthase (NADPH/NADH)
MGMGRAEDFNDRQTEIDANNAAYNPYDYQAEGNGSWAGALPVKQ